MSALETHWPWKEAALLLTGVRPPEVGKTGPRADATAFAADKALYLRSPPRLIFWLGWPRGSGRAAAPQLICRPLGSLLDAVNPIGVSRMRGNARYEKVSSLELRSALLTYGIEFVRDARLVPGVLRIAVVGSILTPKPYPKDIDFLLWITDSCDLGALAPAARRLQGRAQGLNHSADVFLASVEGAYLGRTCHWRECRRGVRASCDALHCGARPHLHDDLATIALEADLLERPPLELWPALTIRVPLPADVQAWVDGLAEGAA